MDKKPEYQFTLKSALLANKKNIINIWVQDYLKSEGNNSKLANYIKAEKKVWTNLIEYDLSKLKRNMGPEKEMVFYENKTKWTKRIKIFFDLVNEGFSLSPIIVTDFWGDIKISDGTHRFEALKKAGIKKYWTIFFIKNPNNVKIILENL